MMEAKRQMATTTEELREQTYILRMATRGFRLFPIEKRSKHPLTKRWPERATCDGDTLRAWVQEYPACNWGLACGLASGLFVLDVDGAEGEAALHELCRQNGYDWLETLTVKTARGRHFYFKYPEKEIRNSASKLARGLDVRGEGGYVLVPPSVHPEGAIYCWGAAGEDEQILPAPAWLLKMLTAPVQRMGPGPAVIGDTIPEGQRNATLTKLAGVMRRQGTTRPAIEAALIAENAGRCLPPLPEAEVREIANSVSRYAPPPTPQNSEQETAVLLDDTRHFILRFLVISDAQAVALCLFILYTFAAEQFECAPYLQITSAEKRSGKSRLLEVLELLVNRPWLTSRTSAAALVRKLHEFHPTLLLDESDAAFSGEKEYSEALRGVLNAGHRKGGKVSLCLGKGCNIKAVDFCVFGPKVIAGIGKLPDTVADRAIPIQLLRKQPSEKVERFRRRLIDPAARDLRERLAQWATQDRLEILRDAWPELPEVLSDRQQDVSEPLLAVADLAGNEWGRFGRTALIEIFGGAAAADESLGIRLLDDIRVVFEGRDRLSSKELVVALLNIEGSPWPELNHGREITTTSIARLLRKFDIAPRTIRSGADTFKGYLRNAFEDAWSRYLAPKSSAAYPDVTPSQPAQSLNGTQFPEPSQEPTVAAQEGHGEAGSIGFVTPVTTHTSEQALHATRTVVGEL
jgi:hypothetical protein